MQLLFSNIWLDVKIFFSLWHVPKTWAEYAIKKMDGANERTLVLSTLWKIMYSQGYSLDASPVAWTKKQIVIHTNVYPNVPRFMKYLRTH